ncbi:GP158 protein, partial [Pelecanoides urinatrix]|nr:GP158 protein [Pelecanoides urinatrix]
CRPCRPGCATCEDDTPCLIQEDRALRAAVLSCQACCMLAVFLSMLVSYHFRRSKARRPQRIRASGVVLLEMILFGSLLLYFPVFILYFKPSIFRCIVLRWVRMLGFAIVYGTITLKLYSPEVPVAFGQAVPEDALHRTRLRPRHVPTAAAVNVLGWMCPKAGRSQQAAAPTPQLSTHRCHPGKDADGQQGDGVGCSASLPPLSPTAEMLFLLWGSFLCHATRAVPSAFHEPRYMGIALHNELMISATFHVVRRGWGSPAFQGPLGQLAPRHPQFLHAGSPLREEIAAEVYEDELDTRRSGSCLNSSIASAWSEHSLDPDDIREELKKLYAQLEVLKTRRMASDNPHLPKKRSSRRSLGRSIARR